jgi:hypothetical protein
MRSQTIDSADAPTHVLVLDAGDEAMAAISAFAREQDLTAAQVTAIGAFEQATVGWFDRRTRSNSFATKSTPTTSISLATGAFLSATARTIGVPGCPYPLALPADSAAGLIQPGFAVAQDRL